MTKIKRFLAASLLVFSISLITLADGNMPGPGSSDPPPCPPLETCMLSDGNMPGPGLAANPGDMSGPGIITDSFVQTVLLMFGLK
jgi:hypothetical protein